MNQSETPAPIANDFTSLSGLIDTSGTQIANGTARSRKSRPRQVDASVKSNAFRRSVEPLVVIATDVSDNFFVPIFGKLAPYARMNPSPTAGRATQSGRAFTEKVSGLSIAARASAGSAAGVTETVAFPAVVNVIRIVSGQENAGPARSTRLINVSTEYAKPISLSAFSIIVDEVATKALRLGKSGEVGAVVSSVSTLRSKAGYFRANASMFATSGDTWLSLAHFLSFGSSLQKSLASYVRFLKYSALVGAERIFSSSASMPVSATL